MARILGDDSDQSSSTGANPRVLIINGVRYTSAAARFWASLLDEVSADYPDCDAMLFETVTGTVLTRDLLFPEMALQRELDRLQSTIRIEQELQEALDEFKIFGPPGAVQLKLLVGDREVKRFQLPLDCVDADIFAYLLAWLLEWAELPSSQWNSDRVEGAFPVRDPDPDSPEVGKSRGKAGGRLQFEFTREHISEGLYRWRLLLRPSLR